ncbi:AMP-binding protein [Mycobacterium sp. URHB0021]
MRKGDRIALVLPTCPEFVECFFGVLYAGAVPVPLYPPVRLGRLEEYHRKTAAMLAAVDAALVVTDQRIRRFLGVTVDISAPRVGCVIASSLGGTTTSVEMEVADDDVALIQFSSGTTNDPKPVALTHDNLLSNLAAIDRYLADEGVPNRVGVTWLPLYHDMGLIGNLLSAFYVPAKLVLLPPELFVAVPAAWLRAISRHRGTVTAAPNFAFGLCLKRIRDEELDGVDLSSWRVSLNGAEAVTAAAQRRFDERFGRWGLRASALTPCYGMAEASLGVTFKPAGTSFRTLGVDAEKLALKGIVEPGAEELVSVGRPLAGVEVEIRGAAGVAAAWPCWSRRRSGAQRDGGLLGPDRPDRSRATRRLAGLGRPRVHPRRRALFVRPAQGHHHCARRQPRPRGVRGRAGRTAGCPHRMRSRPRIHSHR